MLAQSNAGRQIFIPVGVGDITTFIPLLPAPGNATATTVNQSVGGNTYKLKWQEVSDIAYYQINIIDDQGKTHTRQTTELNYELGALPVGTSRVSVLACNLEDQCGAGAYLGTFTATESVIYSIADSLGSPILELDQAGNVLSEMHYKPYGETKEEKKEGIGYTGHLEDTDLGLTYMQARYYDPVLGRFLSNDPVGFLGQLQRGNHISNGFNRYAYVNNNPYKYVDPTGKYGRGTGFTDKQWKNFDRAQQRAAKTMSAKADKLDKKADKLDEKGKAGGDSLRTTASHLRAGAEALSSDGSDGYIANGMSSSDYESSGGSAGGMARAAVGGQTMTVNTGHREWNRSASSNWAVAHESLHSAGMKHQYGSNGAPAYKQGTEAQVDAFNELKGTPGALLNPDHIVDMIY